MTKLSSSPPRRALALAILATAAGAVMTPSAWADGPATYCVHQSGYTCPATSTDEGPALQTALDDAAAQTADASSPNLIVIGPGTYSGAGSGFSYPSSNPLRIEGAGASTSTLTAGPNAATVLSLGSTAAAQTISVSGLAIRVPAQDGVGLDLTGGAADHLAVTFDAAYATGVRLTGGTLSSSSVSGVNNYAGVTTQGARNELDDDTIAARTYGVLATGPTAIHRLNVTAADGVYAADSAVDVDDSLVRAQNGLVAQEQSAEASINALNDTVVALTGAADGVASNAGTAAGADVQVLNSIISGFPLSFSTSRAQAGAPATIEAFSDNYDHASSPTGVTRSAPVGDGPGFVDAGGGDYHLAYNSDLIDASSIQNVGGGSSTTDLDGNPRVVVDGNAATPVDLGAYEYQHRPPDAQASATPSGVSPGTVVSFDATGSHDPDDGDHLTYSWAFDDGATATGPTADHAFSSAGQHSGTLTVADSSGLTSSATATVTVTLTVTNPNSGTGTGTPPAGSNPGTGVAPLGGSGTRGATGTSSHPAAAGRLRVAGPPVVRGSAIRITLSCTGGPCAGVKVTATHVRRGHRVVVGSLSTRIAAGTARAFTIALNRTGRALLAGAKGLPVLIIVTSGTGRHRVNVAMARVRVDPSTRHTIAAR